MTEARRQNLKTYVNGGGKVFLEHYFASFLTSTSYACRTLRRHRDVGRNLDDAIAVPI